MNEQLISMLKMSKKFAVQLDDSTDVADCLLLMTYVLCFTNPVDAVIKEELL
jgi:hypothetical protein